jgi:RNA polymerase sigma-70 factor (ECF subfamily)
MGAMSRQLDQARRGEAEALSALYRQFLPGVFGYIATRVPDRATAEDLTSEVFMKMVEGIGQLRAGDEAAFAAWLFQVARITVAGYYRKRERLPAQVSLDQENQEDTTPDGAETLVSIYLGMDPAEVVETRDEWHTVVKAINALTEEQRQVLVGRLIMGYDVETVARMIGKKANAVKSLQFRALHSLHRLLGKPGLAEQTTTITTRQWGGNS